MKLFDERTPTERRWGKLLREQPPGACLEADALLELAEMSESSPDYWTRMEHIARCRHCRALLQRVRALDAKSARMPRSRFARFRVWQFAAVGIGALAVAVWFVFAVRPPHSAPLAARDAGFTQPNSVRTIADKPVPHKKTSHAPKRLDLSINAIAKQLGSNTSAVDANQPSAYFVTPRPRLEPSQTKPTFHLKLRNIPKTDVWYQLKADGKAVPLRETGHNPRELVLLPQNALTAGKTYRLGITKRGEKKPFAWQDFHIGMDKDKETAKRTQAP